MKIKFKAVWSVLMAIALVLTTGFASYVYGETVSGTVDFGTYTISYAAENSGEGVKITAYSGTLPEVFTVPSILDGYTVTGIGEYAFSPMNADYENTNTDIVQLTIPDSVQVIEEGAFVQTVRLQSISFSEGLQSIGTMAFAMCPLLETVELPASVTQMTPGALAANLALREIRVRAGNTAFAAVDNVLYTADIKTLLQYPIGKAQATFVMPDTVEIIEETAFAYANFKNVKLSASLKRINSSAFFNCLQLTGIDLPASLEQLAGYAFFDCPKLKSMSVANPQMVFESDASIWLVNSDFVLYGYNGSTAQTYSENNARIAFQVLAPASVVLQSGVSVSALWGTYAQNGVITDCDGLPISADSLVGTGAGVTVMDENGTTIVRQTAVLVGDINGDALCDDTDYALLKRISVQAEALHSGDAFMQAADFELDGVIDAFDVAAYDLYRNTLAK